MLRRVSVSFAALAVLLAGALSAQAGIVITVNKTTQRLAVSINGEPRYEWPVSTARWGYRTPNGSYRPERLERQWYSRKYDMSPMPYSIFFDGGYAIHGSYEISRIGRPASHGCIRLNPRNAAVLYSLVRAHVDDTRIVVKGVGASEWREQAHERARYERPVLRETTRRERHVVRETSLRERPVERGERSVARERWRQRGDDTFERGFSDGPDYDAPPQYEPHREYRAW